MLRRLVWLPFLVALPCAAGADDVRAAEPAIVSADASDEAAALDLNVDPDLPSGQAIRRAAPRPQARPESKAGEPFSLGLDIKTRREVGNEARQSASDPTLGDEVEGLVKRSTFGVTGTYHF